MKFDDVSVKVDVKGRDVAVRPGFLARKSAIRAAKDADARATFYRFS